MASVDDITRRGEAVLQGSGQFSVGVLRVLNGDVGKPGEEREYKAGDEALVEAGLAEWVVAPIHHPGAGRRLDGQGGAEREATPADGVEAYPPAIPTAASRVTEARVKGTVKAASDEGVAEKLAGERARLGRKSAARGGDAKLQAELGGRSARSGPVTAQSDLPADQPVPVADEKSAKK